MILELAVILGTAAVNGAIMLAVLKAELRHVRRENTRAHRRLDMIGAPNVTLDES